jgi:putative acetyltransferase
VSWAAPVVALHLAGGAGQGFSTWNHSFVCEHPRILIRREDPTDHAAVRTIVGEAFKDQASPGAPPVEIGLIDALRASSEWIPQLSLVAESDEQTVVGYVICTRGWVDGRPALGLGPLAVAPATQRRGAGSALVYYPRFGFRPAGKLGVAPPVAAWASHFQVRTLTAYQPDLRGTFRYAQPFDDL